MPSAPSPAPLLPLPPLPPLQKSGRCQNNYESCHGIRGVLDSRWRRRSKSVTAPSRNLTPTAGVKLKEVSLPPSRPSHAEGGCDPGDYEAAMTTPCKTGAAPGGGGTRPRLAGKVARLGRTTTPLRLCYGTWTGLLLIRRCRTCSFDLLFVCYCLFPFLMLTHFASWLEFAQQGVLFVSFCLLWVSVSLLFIFIFLYAFIVSALIWVCHIVTVHFLLSLVNICCNFNQYSQLFHDKL